MKKKNFCFPRLEDTRFWEKCSQRGGMLLLLFVLLIAGIAAGALLSFCLVSFRDGRVLPLFFSGIPLEGTGLLSSFSTFLLNLLIFLTFSFLLGVTAFGGFALPLLVLLKGLAVGLGASYFLWTDGLYGLGKSVLLYAPTAAASLLLFLLFSLRALAFSDCLRQFSFSSREGSLDFHEYFMDYLRFLCLAVVVSLLGGALSVLGSIFLP